MDYTSEYFFKFSTHTYKLWLSFWTTRFEIYWHAYRWPTRRLITILYLETLIIAWYYYSSTSEAPRARCILESSIVFIYPPGMLCRGNSCAYSIRMADVSKAFRPRQLLILFNISNNALCENKRPVVQTSQRRSFSCHPKVMVHSSAIAGLEDLLNVLTAILVRRLEIL